MLGVYTLPVMILSPIAGALVVRSGGRPPIIWGLCSLIVGLLVLAAGIGGSIAFVVVGLLVHRRRRGARVDADHQRGDGGGAA